MRIAVRHTRSFVLCFGYLFLSLLIWSTALSFIMGLLVWISARQLEKPCPRVALGRLRGKVLLLSVFTELGRCCFLLSNERGGLRSHQWNVSGEGRLGESRWPAQHSTAGFCKATGEVAICLRALITGRLALCSLAGGCKYLCRHRLFKWLETRLIED